MCTLPLLILLQKYFGTKCPVVGVIFILFFNPWLFFLLKTLKITRPFRLIYLKFKSNPFPHLFLGNIISSFSKTPQAFENN